MRRSRSARRDCFTRKIKRLIEANETKFWSPRVRPLQRSVRPAVRHQHNLVIRITRHRWQLFDRGACPFHRIGRDDDGNLGPLVSLQSRAICGGIFEHVRGQPASIHCVGQRRQIGRAGLRFAAGRTRRRMFPPMIKNMGNVTIRARVRSRAEQSRSLGRDRILCEIPTRLTECDDRPSDGPDTSTQEKLRTPFRFEKRGMPFAFMLNDLRHCKKFRPLDWRIAPPSRRSQMARGDRRDRCSR